MRDNDEKHQPMQPSSIPADSSEDAERTGSFPVVRPRPSRRLRTRKGTGESEKDGRGRGSKILSSALIFVLCVLIGFAASLQQHSAATNYATLSESELVRLLDETNQQLALLESQRNRLQSQLESVQSAVDKQQQLKAIEDENRTTEGILAGTLPAEGQGVTITITQGNKRIDAATLFNLLEELRNSGAEVIQVNTVRVVTSTHFTDTDTGVACDGTPLDSPYTFRAIGDKNALEDAVTIAGGVGSRLRVQYGATVKIEKSDDIRITRTRSPRPFSYAKTVE